MKNKSNLLLFFSIVFIIFSYNTEDEIENPQQNNNAIAIYNQAYQENYEIIETHIKSFNNLLIRSKESKNK